MKSGLCQKTSTGTDTYCYDANMQLDEFTSPNEYCALYSQCAWYFQMEREASPVTGYCSVNQTDPYVTNLKLFADCQQTKVDGRWKFCDQQVYPGPNDNA